MIDPQYERFLRTTFSEPAVKARFDEVRRSLLERIPYTNDREKQFDAIALVRAFDTLLGTLNADLSAANKPKKD